jgi:hypothetical protein
MRFSTRAVLLPLLALAVALVAGCFSPKEPECAFGCDFAGDRLCPEGYTCQNDNYCHRNDHPGACTNMPPWCQCAANETCTTDGRCLLNDGEACIGDGSACFSGFCADGVCCDAACDGTCEACDVTGTVGQCTAVATGEQDPDTCAGTGECCQADQTCGTDGCQ